MRFLCDVHIALKVSKYLEHIGHPTVHVNHILKGYFTKDKEIADFADREERIIISKDQDFRNGFLLDRKPKKLIKVNLGNISTSKLLTLLEARLEGLEKLNSETEFFMVELYPDHWTITK